MKKLVLDKSSKYFLLGFLAAMIFLGFSLTVILLLKDAQSKVNFMDAISPVVDFAAAILLFAAAKKSATRSKRLALAWGIIATALLSYSLGDAIWAMLEVGLKAQPFPSIADAFYLAYYPLFLAGVFLMQEKTITPGTWINKTLEFGILILSSILVYWNFLLGPIIKSNIGLPRLDQIILFAYPVGDLVLLIALIIIIYNYSKDMDRHSAIFLGASILAMIITDSIYSFQSLLGTYNSGGILDLGWIASALMAGLSGLSVMVVFQSAGGSSTFSPFKIIKHTLQPITQILPYVWLMVAFGLLVVGGITPLPMSFMALSMSVGGIIILVLIRQINVLNENRILNTHLHNANQELQDEIIERKKIEEQLSYDNLHDALTGLANRILFLDRLGQAIEYSKRSTEHQYAVLFLDLDQFKVVNDSLGHLLGDQLLMMVAQRLKESLRSSDTIARFGGDEFEILVKISPSKESSEKVSRKIHQLLQSPFMVEGNELFVSASMGIVLNLCEYNHAEDLLQDADIAMYRAKALGGGRSVVFNIEMRHQAYTRLEIEKELRNALENNEFRLYYQPIMALKANHLMGFEALIRWYHPTKGIVLPNEFLQIAEESGLILPMAEWVLHTACSQMKEWQEEYPLLRNASMSVNISSRQLSSISFCDRVMNALQKSGLAAKYLILEITEGVLIKNFSIANEIFNQLRNQGIQLQIDDFGTGYSALGYLHRFPINAIKIDKTFIREMDINHRGLELVRAIVSMAKELGIDAIAEGIETDQQLDELLNMYCGFGQGYLLSKPFEPCALPIFLDTIHTSTRQVGKDLVLANSLTSDSE